MLALQIATTQQNWTRKKVATNAAQVPRGLVLAAAQADLTTDDISVGSIELAAESEQHVHRNREIKQGAGPHPTRVEYDL